MKPNNIYLGDCLDLMADIDDHSIDMILADLPYGTTQCTWDSIIPLELLWAHYKRVIKRNGAIILNSDGKFTPILQMSNFEWYKYKWVWDKIGTTGWLNSKIRPLKADEDICVFYENQPTFNPQMKPKTKEEVSRMSKVSRILTEDITTPNYGKAKIKRSGRDDKNALLKFPNSIIRINKLHNHKSNNKEGGLHPTQKPVALFSYLVRTYTNPGDIVLDNVIGSGTTAIAAIETGRQWIGIEKDEAYYHIAKKRIEKRLQQPLLIESSEI